MITDHGNIRCHTGTGINNNFSLLHIKKLVRFKNCQFKFTCEQMTVICRNMMSSLKTLIQENYHITFNAVSLTA